MDGDPHGRGVPHGAADIKVVLAGATVTMGKNRRFVVLGPLEFHSVVDSAPCTLQPPRVCLSLWLFQVLRVTMEDPGTRPGGHKASHLESIQRRMSAV